MSAISNTPIPVMFLFLLSFTIRAVWILYAIPTQPIQGDESTYVSAAQHIIAWFVGGQFQLTADLQFNYTQPMFAKLLFAIGILWIRSIFSDLTSARLVSALMGSIGAIAFYLIGKKLFRNSVLALASGIAFSFTPAYFYMTTTAMLDGISTALVAISFLFLLRSRFTGVFDKDMLLSGIFMGLALASKFLALTGALVSALYILLCLRTRFVKYIVILGISSFVIFLLVQPRMWFDPFSRLPEFWSGNAGNLGEGRTISVSSLPGGDASWQVWGAMTSPPWWTIIYWVISTVSPFQLIGLTLFGLSISEFKFRITNLAERFSILSFSVALAFFTSPINKFPQYLSFLVPGLTLIVLVGYQIAPVNLVLPLSMTQLLELPEVFLFVKWGLSSTGVTFADQLMLTPSWRHPLQFSAIIIITAAWGYARYKHRPAQERGLSMLGIFQIR